MGWVQLTGFGLFGEGDKRGERRMEETGREERRKERKVGLMHYMDVTLIFNCHFNTV